MKKFLLHILLTSLLLLPACNESAIADKVNASIVRLSRPVVELTSRGLMDGQYICTGFVIQPDVVLTAKHCVGPDLMADGYQTKLLQDDAYYDLALISVPKLSKPALTFRATPVITGEELFGIGYGNGWRFPIAMRVRVVHPNVVPHIGSPSGIISQGGFVSGMSGGPQVDLDGNVVGIVQQKLDSNLGYGVGFDMIKAFLLDAGINMTTGGIDWLN